MRNNKKIFLIVILICGGFMSVVWAGTGSEKSAEKPPSILELVRKARQNQPDTKSGKNDEVTQLISKFLENHNDEQLNSFVIKTESLVDYDTRLKGTNEREKAMAKQYNGKHKERIHEEYRYDGQRTYRNSETWPNDAVNDKYEPIGNSRYMSYLFDGKHRMRYGGDRTDNQSCLVVVYRNANIVKNEALPVMVERHTLGLYSLGRAEHKQLDSIIKEADSATVRNEHELVGSSKCYIIDVVKGKNTWIFWIDPEHAYNVSKVEYSEIDDLGSKTTLAGEVVRYEKINDIWIPMESIASRYRLYHSDIGYEKSFYKIRITEIDLDPDHDALGSFEPDDIPNGTRTFISGVSKITYRWRDDKVVDSYGHEVDLETMGPPSMIGKTLPDLAQFNINLNPEQIKDKMLFVCFWDMNQRPSRNAIQTLNKKASSLMDNGLYMVFIHAGPVAKQTLVPWLNQNEIQPPMGVSRDGLPELGSTWGIRSLPWLILTNKNHTVIAEGFAFNELDDEIKETQKRNISN